MMQKYVFFIYICNKFQNKNFDYEKSHHHIIRFSYCGNDTVC